MLTKLLPSCVLQSAVGAWVWLMMSSTVFGDESTSQWIRQLGGKSTLNAAGDVVAVDLKHAWLTDADLQRLALLPTLESIDLSYTKVGDEGLEQLKPLTNVRRLNLYYAEYVSDAGIAHLKNWSKLEFLNARGTKVTSTLFDHLINMPELRELDVGFSRVNDDNFERLSELPKLEKLFIGGNKMSGAALPLLKLVPSLRALGVGGQQRTDSGLWSVNLTDFNCSHVSDLKYLTELDISDCNISDRGLTQLAKLKDLERLDLRRTKVSAKGIEALAVLPKLSELDLSGCKSVDDAALKACARLTTLVSLRLQESAITAEGMADFKAPASLKRLYVGGITFTAEQLASVREQLPEVHVSWWKAN
ncbi:MAG: hypothetical protein IT423_00950 [Pirellulaceae bacterium]|nr:hypothetical protein [Pirellulaceae bacterium]